MGDKDTNILGPTDLKDDDPIAYTLIEAERAAADSVPVTCADHEANATWVDGVKVF